MQSAVINEWPIHALDSFAQKADLPGQKTKDKR